MAESLTVDGVMNALRNCYDPEIPVNIVDLGLIYGVAIDDDNVKVRMTLTTVGCPAHAYLMHQVQTEIEKIPGVKKAEVEIVWEPPWTPDKMSPEAKKRLEAAQEPVTIEFNPSTFKPRKKGHIAKNPDGKIVLINEANSRYLGSVTHRDSSTSPREHNPAHNHRARSSRGINHSAPTHINRHQIPLDNHRSNSPDPCECTGN